MQADARFSYLVDYVEYIEVRDTNHNISQSSLSQNSWGIFCVKSISPFLFRMTPPKTFLFLVSTERFGTNEIHQKKVMSPWNIKNSVRKLESFGCHEILLINKPEILSGVDGESDLSEYVVNGDVLVLKNVAT